MYFAINTKKNLIDVPRGSAFINDINNNLNFLHALFHLFYIKKSLQMIN